MTTILFFDDQPLDRMDNVARRVGNPELIPESVYIDPDVNTHFGNPIVFQDEASGKWRLIYEGRNAREPNSKLMAESDDGIHWSPRDTTKELDLPDRKHAHQILPIEGDGRLNSYIDLRADPAERVKSLVGREDPYMIVSSDGLHWTRREAKWHHIAPPDPPTLVFWNDVRQSYVLTTRPEGGDRRVCVSETKDWETYSVPELALQCDSLDAPLTQIYAMPVIPYEGIYIGFVWLFHCIPEPPNKYLGGHMDCQLAYSLNGWHFQRGPREPFVPNGPPGSPDSGVVYPYCMIPQEDGSLRIYASACTMEHGNTPEGDTGSIIAYSLRRDGFVYMESTGGNGVVGTRQIYWRGGEAQLNVQSQGGDVRVQVTDIPRRLAFTAYPPVTPLDGYSFDDCEPFSGDDTAWTPTWKGGKTLADLSGQAIRLDVQLNSARLYAIRGDFVQMSNRQHRTFSADGVVPEPRSGL